MSATNQFAKLDHRAPLPQAGVNRVGPGWSDTLSNDRSDPVTYLPLHSPGALPAPTPREASPPPPTEAELREVLMQTIAAKQFSDDQLARAAASAARAVQYVADRKAHLESFAGLDDEVTTITVEALRSGDGRLDLDESIRRKQAARDVARADVAAAERAQAVLAEALIHAQADAASAATAARKAAVAVAAIEAQGLAQRVLDLEDEAARTREIVYAFDRIAAGTGVPLPAAVFDVSVSNPQPLRRLDASAWIAALDALMNDATVEVSIPIPDPVPARPLRYSHEITYAVPIRPLAEAVVTDLPEPAGED